MRIKIYIYTRYIVFPHIRDDSFKMNKSPQEPPGMEVTGGRKEGGRSRKDTELNRRRTANTPFINESDTTQAICYSLCSFYPKEGK